MVGESRGERGGKEAGLLNETGTGKGLKDSSGREEGRNRSERGC